MNFAPKKSKYRKAHKGQIHNLNAIRGINLDKGSYGLIALESGRIDGNQLESARVTLNRKIKKLGVM
jgi:large subunit ribosomal protein L16